MTTIILTPFYYKNTTQIAISSNNDDHIIATIRSLAGVEWSQIHKTLYLPYTSANKQRLYRHLRHFNYYVDYSALKNLREAYVTDIPLARKAPLRALSKDHYVILENFKTYLRQKRYSKNTETTYVGVLVVFFRFHNAKDIKDINEADVVLFNQDYILQRGYGRTFQNQVTSALKLFYKYYDHRNLIVEEIERPKKEKRLPEILSKEEVKQLLISIKNVKHKTILSLVYACGLRIGEALSLKIDDIDSTRGFIHIKHAKGAKDRYVPLSDKTLALLRHYYQLHRPKKYLFEGVDGGMYSQESCRKILRKAIRSTRIKKHVTLHTLRHSYATHLLESGTDLRYIQTILGHNSPKTTMIYTHVSEGSLKKIKNPFDDMDI